MSGNKSTPGFPVGITRGELSDIQYGRMTPSNGTVGTDVAEWLDGYIADLYDKSPEHYWLNKIRDTLQARAAVEAIGLGEIAVALRKLLNAASPAASLRLADHDLREAVCEASVLLANLHPITIDDGEIPDHG